MIFFERSTEAAKDLGNLATTSSFVSDGGVELLDLAVNFLPIITVPLKVNWNHVGMYNHNMCCLNGIKDLSNIKQGLVDKLV